MTLSTPVKIVALAGLALVLGLGGLLMLTAKHGAAAPIAVPPPVRHAAPAPRAHHAAPKPHVVLAPGLPPVLRLTLLRHPVAVVAIYSSRVADERAVLAEARAGAHSTHAGFVAANIANKGIAAAVAGWSNTAKVPAVLVVRRPGRVVFGVSGPTDRKTVAQAVLTAK